MGAGVAPQPPHIPSSLGFQASGWGQGRKGRGTSESGAWEESRGPQGEAPRVGTGPPKARDVDPHPIRRCPLTGPPPTRPNTS